MLTAIVCNLHLISNDWEGIRQDFWCSFVSWTRSLSCTNIHVMKSHWAVVHLITCALVCLWYIYISKITTTFTRRAKLVGSKKYFIQENRNITGWLIFAMIYYLTTCHGSYFFVKSYSTNWFKKGQADLGAR